MAPDRQGRARRLRPPPDTPLKRLAVHWFNLPDFHARLGRWETESDGWKVTLDVRPDHDRVWTDLDKAHIYVMTHVMELRRRTAAECSRRPEGPPERRTGSMAYSLEAYSMSCSSLRLLCVRTRASCGSAIQWRSAKVFFTSPAA